MQNITQKQEEREKHSFTQQELRDISLLELIETVIHRIEKRLTKETRDAKDNG